MSSDPKGYYATLGLGASASPGEIKEAYRRLVKAFHPDTNRLPERDADRLKEINEAYNVLRNAEKRDAYDRLGSMQLATTIDVGDISDPFHEIRVSSFDNAARMSSGRPRVSEKKRTGTWPIILAAAALILIAGVAYFGFFNNSGPKNLNAGTVFTDCSHCPPMVVLSPGSFVMGMPLGRPINPIL